MYYLQDILTYTPEESKQNLEDAIAESKSKNRKKYSTGSTPPVTTVAS